MVIFLILALAMVAAFIIAPAVIASTATNATCTPAEMIGRYTVLWAATFSRWMCTTISPIHLNSYTPPPWSW